MQPTRLSTQWSQRIAGRETAPDESRRTRRGESDGGKVRRTGEAEESGERRSEDRISGRRVGGRNWADRLDPAESEATTTTSNPAASASAVADAHANIPSTAPGVALTPDTSPAPPADTGSISTPPPTAPTVETAPGVALTPDTPPAPTADTGSISTPQPTAPSVETTSPTAPAEPTTSTTAPTGEASDSTGADASAPSTSGSSTWDVIVPRDPEAAVQPFPFAQPSGVWASVSRTVMDGSGGAQAAPLSLAAGGGLRMQGTAFRIDRSQSTRPQSVLEHGAFALQMNRAAARYAAMSALTQLVTRNEQAVQESLTTSRDRSNEGMGRLDGLA